jgi:hypothetical protein
VVRLSYGSTLPVAIATLTESINAVTAFSTGTSSTGGDVSLGVDGCTGDLNSFVAPWGVGGRVRGWPPALLQPATNSVPRSAAAASWRRERQGLTPGDYRGRGRLGEGFVHNMYGPQPCRDTTSRDAPSPATQGHGSETLRLRDGFLRRLVRP